VLKINYRNTAEVLSLATRTAGHLLAGQEPDDEAASDIVHQQPLAAGRSGPLPELLRAGSPREEAEQVAERIADAVAEGIPPADIGILARYNHLLDPIERALHQQGIPTQRLKGADGKHWQPDSVKLTTLHASKGLEFHAVAIVGLQAVPDPRNTEDEEWRLLYVAMTRATHRLVLAGCGASGAVEKVAGVLGNAARIPAAA
jgi:superfamily I DNA/RNA helicase